MEQALRQVFSGEGQIEIFVRHLHALNRHNLTKLQDEDELATFIADYTLRANFSFDWSDILYLLMYVKEYAKEKNLMSYVTLFNTFDQYIHEAGGWSKFFELFKRPDCIKFKRYLSRHDVNNLTLHNRKCSI